MLESVCERMDKKQKKQKRARDTSTSQTDGKYKPVRIIAYNCSPKSSHLRLFLLFSNIQQSHAAVNVDLIFGVAITRSGMHS